jgi:hypothetical protein
MFVCIKKQFYDYAYMELVCISSLCVSRSSFMIMHTWSECVYQACVHVERASVCAYRASVCAYRESERVTLERMPHAGAGLSPGMVPPLASAPEQEQGHLHQTAGHLPATRGSPSSSPPTRTSSRCSSSRFSRACNVSILSSIYFTHAHDSSNNFMYCSNVRRFGRAQPQHDYCEAHSFLCRQAHWG